MGGDRTRQPTPRLTGRSARHSIRRHTTFHSASPQVRDIRFGFTRHSSRLHRERAASIAVRQHVLRQQLASNVDETHVAEADGMSPRQRSLKPNRCHAANGGLLLKLQVVLRELLPPLFGAVTRREVQPLATPIWLQHTGRNQRPGERQRESPTASAADNSRNPQSINALRVPCVPCVAK